MQESSILFSALLSVIHPNLYLMGMQAMERLPMHCDNAGIYEIWASLFHGVQVLANRATPVHRDNGSWHPWFDLLATMGPYHSAFLYLPGAGVYLAYSSGTVVGLCGRVLSHGVSVAEGERMCLAYYMRKNVQSRLRVHPAGWSEIQQVTT